MEERKPKVFIAGISGFLGYHLALHLKNDYLVSGVYFRNPAQIPGTQIFPVDAQKTELLEPLIRVQAPDFIINAVGLTNPKSIEANPKLADNLNVLMAVSLAALSNKMRKRFIQLSCARVYEGSYGGYTEDFNDFTMYDEFGKQKVSAESFIRSQTLESTVLRLGKVVGLGNPHRPTTFDRFRAKISTKQKVEASKRQRHSYLSTVSLCRAVSLLLCADFPHKHRIFNLGGADLSEYELFEGWARLVGGDGGLVKPKPEDSPLDLTIKSDSFASAHPEWKPECKEELYLNLLRDLTPGVGLKKWQKTLQTP